MWRKGLLVQRILLLAAASIACAWLAASLVAAHSLNQANHVAVKALAGRASPAEVATARRDLHRARRFNADDRALYLEARLLLSDRRPRQGIPVARRLLRLQPRDFDGWVVLWALGKMAHSDVAVEARRHAIALNPDARAVLRP
jgi:hypothetical protein